MDRGKDEIMINRRTFDAERQERLAGRKSDLEPSLSAAMSKGGQHGQLGMAPWSA